MNEKQFYEAINLLATETKILRANTNKLAIYAHRNKKDKCKGLFDKIAFDTAYLKKLYSNIQTWAYWNKGKIDQEEWQLFTKEFDGLFSTLETIIENIKARNEVMANGNS